MTSLSNVIYVYGGSTVVKNSYHNNFGVNYIVKIVVFIL